MASSLGTTLERIPPKGYHLPLLTMGSTLCLAFILSASSLAAPPSWPPKTTTLCQTVEPLLTSSDLAVRPSARSSLSSASALDLSLKEATWIRKTSPEGA